MSQGAACVTESFLGTANATSKRMLNVAPIEKALRETDAMRAKIFNPFASHSRLQALMNKAQNPEDLVYIVRALQYQA
eukprot:11170269-Lingulodinium_polyedra.AAC.1